MMMMFEGQDPNLNHLVLL